MTRNPGLMQIIDIKALSPNSKIKLRQFEIDLGRKTNLHPKLKQLFDKMYASFKIELNIKPGRLPNLNSFREIFIDFDKNFNSINNSKFQKDIMNMSQIYSIEIKINSDIIILNFLAPNNNSVGYVASITQAVHTFCHAFPYDYDGLVIDVSLDSNNRNLIFPTNNKNMKYDDIFEYLHKKSAAFNVSGVTMGSNKHIIVTKTEEIIKLLYHEMIHFVGLDDELRKLTLSFPWAVNKNNLNLSEAYTEFMSVIINSAYLIIQLSGIQILDLYDCYNSLLYAETQYSLYLTTNILKFFGYNNNNYKNFFNGIGEKKFSPILVWEYIIIRTQLLLNRDSIAEIMGNNIWRVNESNINDLIPLMKTDNNLLNKLSFFMENTNIISNISYLLVDFDWNLF